MMDIAAWIIVIVFLGLVATLMMELLHRAIASLLGAVICFLALYFLKHEPFGLIVGYIFGTAEDGYVNFHSLLLIFSMTLIVQICNKAGVFKFISFRLVLAIIDRPQYLLLILCMITVVLSAILNNILTVMIIIPLIITISRILNIDPEPLIISQAILVNIGGTVFSISSIPNILIANSANITFNEFFLNVGLLALFVFLVTVAFFYILFYGKITVQKENVKILKEFNPWNFVQNKRLLLTSAAVLLLVMVGFIIIPATVLSSDVIALIGALALVLLSRLDIDKIVEDLQIDLYLYLMGVFVIAGSLEYTGILEEFGLILAKISGKSFLLALLLILWSSALLSSTIDNIPITKVLIPSIGSILSAFPGTQPKIAYYSLAIGANWGDNLTPMGDNILVMNIAEKNKRPIRMKEFWRIGFITTLIQLLFASAYLIMLANFLVGFISLVVLVIGFSIFGYLFITEKKGTLPNSLKKTFQNVKARLEKPKKPSADMKIVQGSDKEEN